MINRSYKEYAKRQVSHHEQSFDARLRDGSVDVWFNPDSADYWGNTIAYESLKAPFAVLSSRKCLTAGDGKGGKDAIFLKSLGHSVVASDCCTDVLREAKRQGLIDEYAEINAEQIAYPDESFDIVFHYCPVKFG